MKPDIHERAKQQLALGEPFVLTQPWLQVHLQECAACRDYADGAARAIRALRSQPFAADSALVQATQMRVRARALELRRRRERLGIVCLCAVAVTLASAFTTAVLWNGFFWLGQQWRIHAPLSQFAMLAVGLLPAIVVSILFLARGTHLADSRPSLQP
jgi:predicted anti-sigma-YlaC factor YlaD